MTRQEMLESALELATKQADETLLQALPTEKNVARMLEWSGGDPEGAADRYVASFAENYLSIARRWAEHRDWIGRELVLLGEARKPAAW